MDDIDEEVNGKGHTRINLANLKGTERFRLKDIPAGKNFESEDSEEEEKEDPVPDNSIRGMRNNLQTKLKEVNLKDLDKRIAKDKAVVNRRMEESKQATDSKASFIPAISNMAEQENEEVPAEEPNAWYKREMKLLNAWKKTEDKILPIQYWRNE